MRRLQRLQSMGGTALAPAIASYARARTRPGLMLIISDLLSGEPPDLQEALHDLRARGWQTAMVHIVDEAEIDPAATRAWLRDGEAGPGAASLELVDRESRQTLRLTLDDDVVTRYGAAVASWLQALEAACAVEAASYARVSTTWALDDVTLALLHERGVVA